MHQNGLSWPHRWRSVFFWVLFATGLLTQAFSPHLKIKNNGFVVPPSLVSSGAEVQTLELVARERGIQFLSAVLTLGGAIGLALCYREVLLGRRSTQRDLASGNNVASDDPGIVK